MMEKMAKPQDLKANAAKAEMNTRAAELLKLDEDALHQQAVKIADAILAAFDGAPRVVVTGGAGSGKTTLAVALEKELGVKNFDFDEYIPGGWTADVEEYARRFHKGLYELWEDVPPKKGWIIEHVEACRPELLGLYNPDFAVLVDPGEERLRQAAEARTAVAGNGEGRLPRALQSDNKAKAQFKALKGKVLLTVPGFVLKKVEG
jgi:hypothetical protein